MLVKPSIEFQPGMKIAAFMTCALVLLQAVPLKGETYALWQQLFKDVSKFDDFRHFKAEVGGCGPDFRHKETMQGLW